MLSRWQGGLGALVVTLTACALVILDLADHGLRHWWAEPSAPRRRYPSY